MNIFEKLQNKIAENCPLITISHELYNEYLDALEHAHERAGIECTEKGQAYFKGVLFKCEEHGR